MQGSPKVVGRVDSQMPMWVRQVVLAKAHGPDTLDGRSLVPISAVGGPLHDVEEVSYALLGGYNVETSPLTKRDDAGRINVQR